MSIIWICNAPIRWLLLAGCSFEDIIRSTRWLSVASMQETEGQQTAHWLYVLDVYFEFKYFVIIYALMRVF